MSTVLVLSDLESRLKADEHIRTVMQIGVSTPLWVEYYEEAGEPLPKLREQFGELALPAWTKLEFFGFADFRGKDYALFQVRRFDQLVDLEKMDSMTRAMPAIQDAIVFGKQYSGQLVLLDLTQVSSNLDVI